MQTVASRFDPRSNSLNFLRLVFALVVIVSHTWPLGGYGHDPTFARLNLGIWAVIGFFAISGYLIAASWLHTSITAFLVRRVLRIYPGYLVCLVVVALVFAPLSQALGTGSVQWSSSATYVLHNVLLKVWQNDIQHTLTGAPFGAAWNGSLWTLIYEFLCYLAIGALLSVTRRWRRPLVVAAFVALATIATLEQHVGNEGSLWAFAFLGSVFFAGSLIAVFADRIPLDWRLALVAIVLTVVGGELQQVPWIAAFPAAYACMWLESRCRSGTSVAETTSHMGCISMRFRCSRSSWSASAPDTCRWPPRSCFRLSQRYRSQQPAGSLSSAGHWH